MAANVLRCLLFMNLWYQGMVAVKSSSLYSTIRSSKPSETPDRAFEKRGRATGSVSRVNGKDDLLPPAESMAEMATSPEETCWAPQLEALAETAVPSRNGIRSRGLEASGVRAEEA